MSVGHFVSFLRVLCAGNRVRCPHLCSNSGRSRCSRVYHRRWVVRSCLFGFLRPASDHYWTDWANACVHGCIVLLLPDCGPRVPSHVRVDRHMVKHLPTYSRGDEQLRHYQILHPIYGRRFQLPDCGHVCNGSAEGNGEQFSHHWCRQDHCVHGFDDLPRHLSPRTISRRLSKEPVSQKIDSYVPLRFWTYNRHRDDERHRSYTCYRSDRATTAHGTLLSCLGKQQTVAG
mmetsp:Transcript_29978/g.115113  ORF Transcript_29978/g.115113 Transcript_29978/m.115113 type:complete len:230 (+) Transcript_29978:420-1109(+)